MTIHIAVMDYCSGTIKMYSPDILEDDVQDEDVEHWLEDNTEFKPSQCCYMFSEKEIWVEHL